MPRACASTWAVAGLWLRAPALFDGAVQVIEESWDFLPAELQQTYASDVIKQAVAEAKPVPKKRAPAKKQTARKASTKSQAPATVD